MKTLILIALAAIFLGPTAPLRADIGVGNPFPPILLDDSAGAALPASSGKVLLVDFWASWCAPCKASFAAYARLNAQFAQKGLVIVAISEDQNPSAYRSFVRKLSPPFAVALDKDQKLVSTVQAPTMPTSYLVDRRGRVRFIHAGFHGADTELSLQREIAALLADKAQ